MDLYFLVIEYVFSPNLYLDSKLYFTPCLDKKVAIFQWFQRFYSKLYALKEVYCVREGKIVDVEVRYLSRRGVLSQLTVSVSVLTIGFT